MPLYEYECKKCHHRFERIQKFSDPVVKKCPDCGGPVAQVISAPAVQFKGSGWYVSDYGKKPTPGGDSTSMSESSTDSKPESKPDSKSEAKSEGKSGPKGDSHSTKEDKPKTQARKSEKK